jgi:hypothetical protein
MALDHARDELLHHENIRSGTSKEIFFSNARRDSNASVVVIHFHRRRVLRQALQWASFGNARAAACA